MWPGSESRQLRLNIVTSDHVCLAVSTQTVNVSGSKAWSPDTPGQHDASGQCYQSEDNGSTVLVSAAGLQSGQPLDTGYITVRKPWSAPLWLLSIIDTADQRCSCRTNCLDVSCLDLLKNQLQQLLCRNNWSPRCGFLLCVCLSGGVILFLVHSNTTARRVSFRCDSESTWK